MNTLNELGRVAAETEAALKRWLRTDSIRTDGFTKAGIADWGR